MSHVNVTLSLNNTTDVDIIEWLSTQSNKNAAIKQAIRTPMKEEPDMKVLEYFTQLNDRLVQMNERLVQQLAETKEAIDKLQGVRIEPSKDTLVLESPELKPIPKNVKSAILSGFKPTKKLEETEDES